MTVMTKVDTGFAPKYASHLTGLVSGANVRTPCGERRVENLRPGDLIVRLNNVTIGSEGKVHADVHAKSVCVDGVVKGNLFVSDRVSVRSSSQVTGNISSPRVSLDDGAHFKGSIEMEVEPARDKSSAQPSARSGSPQASKANGDSPVTAQKSASDEAPRAST